MNWRHRFDPRRSLGMRLVAVNLTLILLTLIAVVLWTGTRLQASLIEQTQNELSLRALLVANGLREPFVNQLKYDEEHDKREEDDEEHSGKDKIPPQPLTFATFGDRDLKAIVDAFAADANARLTILDTDLNVRYSSDDAVPMIKERPKPELAAALQGREQHNVRVDDWDEEERLFVASAIDGGDGVQGVVQMSVPMNRVLGEIEQSWAMLISAGAIVALLAVLATIVFARHIIRPVQALTSASNQLAAGDLSTRLDLDRRDELGALAASFDHMAAEIGELLARERAFVAHASHELRSPLTAIQLRAELLENMSRIDAVRVQRYLAEIRDESDHLVLLLEQLLDLNRMQAAPVAELEPLALAPCLTRVAEQLAPRAQQAGLTLGAEIAADLPAVRMRAADCELLVRNLVDNAIKYTPAGGDIELVGKPHSAGVQIIVRDTGIGIPEAALAHVTERFYRVGKTSNRNGSGLGLALVDAIVDRHQGRLDIESREGEGTTVRVWLPAV